MASRFLKQSLLTATLITIGTNVLSRAFGFVREAAIANFFGTSSIFDIFILAITIPEILASVILTALPAAIIPSLKRILLERDIGDSILFWSGFLIFAVFFGFVSFLLYELRECILIWFDPQLAKEQLILGKRLIAILSSYIFFRGMEAYFRSWMFEKKHFIVPVTSNIIFNIAIISSLFLLYTRLNIESLAYGWLIAAIVAFFYNGLFAFIVVKPSVKIGIDKPWVKMLLGSALIIIAVESISLIYPLIDRYLAARYLGPGQISALRYAGVLVQLPTGILVVAFNIAAFPWISDLFSQRDFEKLNKLYKESIRLIIFVMGLVASGIVIFSEEIVQIAFQRGVFDSNSLYLTSSPLMYYALGMVFDSVYIFQMRFYYAKRTILRLGIIRFIMLLIKVFFSVALVGKMEQDGLALATSIAWLSGLILMTIDLGRIMKISIKDLFYPTVLKTLFIIGVVVAFWIGMGEIWPDVGEKNSLPIFLKTLILWISGAVLYFGLALILKLPEPRKVITIIISKFRLSA